MWHEPRKLDKNFWSAVLLIRGAFYIICFHETIFCFSRCPYPLYHRAFPFISLLYLILFFPLSRFWYSLPAGFFHAKVQQVNPTVSRFSCSSCGMYGFGKNPKILHRSNTLWKPVAWIMYRLSVADTSRSKKHCFIAWTVSMRMRSFRTVTNPCKTIFADIHMANANPRQRIVLQYKSPIL